MKNRLFSLLLIGLVFVAGACKKEKPTMKELLAGKWRWENIHYVDVNNGSKSEYDDYQDDGVYIDFQLPDQYIIYDGTGETKGTWILDEKAQILKLNDSTFIIDQLDSGHLVISFGVFVEGGDYNIQTWIMSR